MLPYLTCEGTTALGEELKKHKFYASQRLRRLGQDNSLVHLATLNVSNLLPDGDQRIHKAVQLSLQQYTHSSLKDCSHPNMQR